MAEKITRRNMLGITAGAAAGLVGSDWIFALNGHGEIVRAASEGAEWKPVFFSKKQAEQVAAVCEAIIPRTDTAGAIDARVHEYIDLSLSVDQELRQTNFMDGLKWLDKYCKQEAGSPLHKVSAEDLNDLLAPLSDEHDSHPEELKLGASFFRDIKTRTIFGYYTSKEGRVEELGLGESVRMVTFEGCAHDAH